MRFERDTQTGATITVNIISYVMLLIVAAAFIAKLLTDQVPRLAMAAVVAAIMVYMIAYLVRFLRFLNLWKRASFETKDDRVMGFGADVKLRHGRAFDIPAGEVQGLGFVEVNMTRKTKLPALKLETKDGPILILGLYIDPRMRKSLGLPEH
ncbi:MAG: hypothetical protein IJR17_03255 [Clostridia bacterium]|nr:hypothetical protein [Clostridia bacterium]